MKTATGALTATLYTNNAHLCADLYTFYFPAGTVYYTSADTDITSGVTYLSAGGYLTRGSARATAGVEVSTMDITIGSGSFNVAGTSVVQAAVKGLLDGVRVKIDRAYMTTWGSVPNGVVNVFDGNVVQVEPTNTEVRVTVKSALAKLNERTPRRLFQPQCPYMLFDTGCGLVDTSFRDAQATVAGSTTTMVSASSPSARAYPGSRLTFWSGPLSGTSYTIVSTGSATQFNVFPAMPSAPGIALIYIFNGCDKTRATCSGTFSNIARFGGFPDAPKPEGKI
jgi:uncharacterized phage protein (TIGR02218 family)